jgi:hypothetical protein
VTLAEFFKPKSVAFDSPIAWVRPGIGGIYGSVMVRLESEPTWRDRLAGSNAGVDLR